MHVLITGGCGFVGSCLAKFFLNQDCRVTVVDNLSRLGSQINQAPLECLGAEVLVGDLRNRAWVASLPISDWVIDCAANPSVLAGLRPAGSLESPSQELVDHNLGGTVHLLEYCKKHSAGLILVSSSRVYSIRELSRIPYRLNNSTLEIDWHQIQAWRSDRGLDIRGLSPTGVDESFSIEPPVSLYGSTKLASEWLAKEYSSAFGFPVWINRCGILAGAGQFGKADQGIITYWMHRFLYGHPLRFIGLQGSGGQVRDCLHPEDLAKLIELQIQSEQSIGLPITVNVSGGIASAFSLMELHEWCARRWGLAGPQLTSAVERVLQARPYDVPWLVLDPELAERTWSWKPQKDRVAIWDEIAEHAEENPDWLKISGGID
ncbi:MAG: NAD-dependent epimerase/dehydratase family protein [Pirellula sp.]